VCKRCNGTFNQPTPPHHCGVAWRHPSRSNTAQKPLTWVLGCLPSLYSYEYVGGRAEIRWAASAVIRKVGCCCTRSNCINLPSCMNRTVQSTVQVEPNPSQGVVLLSRYSVLFPFRRTKPCFPTRARTNQRTALHYRTPPMSRWLNQYTWGYTHVQPTPFYSPFPSFKTNASAVPTFPSTIFSTCVLSSNEDLRKAESGQFSWPADLRRRRHQSRPFRLLHQPTF
jgi:hypothetical protein